MPIEYFQDNSRILLTPLKHTTSSETPSSSKRLIIKTMDKNGTIAWIIEHMFVFYAIMPIHSDNHMARGFDAEFENLRKFWASVTSKRY